MKQTLAEPASFRHVQMRGRTVETANLLDHFLKARKTILRQAAATALRRRMRSHDVLAEQMLYVDWRESWAHCYPRPPRTPTLMNGLYTPSGRLRCRTVMTLGRYSDRTVGEPGRGLSYRGLLRGGWRRTLETEHLSLWELC